MAWDAPRVTVDAVIERDGSVVLVKRLNPPYKDMWCIPGGFLELGETAEEGTIREAEEETGLKVEITGLIGVYSDPKRDPRGHTVGIVYSCKVLSGNLKADSDAKEARWFPLNALPSLAFDHKKIMNDYIKGKK